MKITAIDFRVFTGKIIFFILGIFFLYSGFRDTVYLQDLAESMQKLSFLSKLLLLIFLPGLKLCLGGIFLFFNHLLKPACMTAGLFLLGILSVLIYKALTVKTCGVCGEFKKNTIIFNAWKPVVIYFIVLILNSAGFFLLEDDENDTFLEP